MHYTKDIDSLKSILKEGFRVKYCMEQVRNAGGGYIRAAFPMVSFCDIPLSQVREHLDSYGYYGIGFKKEWAKEKQMSPVLYFDKDSELLSIVRAEFQKIKDKEKPIGDMAHLVNLLAYSKNYEGISIHGGKTYDNYRFYNEREWRYVPNKGVLGTAPPYVSFEKYEASKGIYNKTLNHIRLDFTFKDISYIIVKSESEIKVINKVIRDVFSDKCTAQDLEVLHTRIVTTDQIQYDF